MDTTRRAPMTAAEVRKIIATMERETKSKAARKALALAAINLANVTEEGRDVWREYVSTFNA